MWRVKWRARAEYYSQCEDFCPLIINNKLRTNDSTGGEEARVGAVAFVAVECQSWRPRHWWALKFNFFDFQSLVNFQYHFCFSTVDLHRLLLIMLANLKKRLLTNLLFFNRIDAVWRSSAYGAAFGKLNS